MTPFLFFNREMKGDNELFENACKKKKKRRKSSEAFCNGQKLETLKR